MDLSVRVIYSSTEMETLLRAASEGDIETLERSLRPKVDIDARGYLKGYAEESNHEPITMLEVAASHNQLETMQYLIRKGADVNLVDGEASILHAAAYQGRVQVFRLLIDNGADINSKGFRGSSAIHEAVRSVSSKGILDKKLEVVGILLGHEFEIDTPNEDGYTALHLVGNLRIAEFLLNRGADINAKCTAGDRPLDRAAVRGDLEMVEFFIQRGAQVNDNDRGCNGLHLAAAHGYTSMVTFLLDHGATAHISRASNECELFAAAWSGNAATVSLLYERGFAHQGPPALFMAIMVLPIEKIELLLAQGVDINAKTKKGQSVLHLSLLRRHVYCNDPQEFLDTRWEVLRLLLDRGADPEARDRNGQTAKDLAAASNHVGAVEILEARTMLAASS